MNWLMMVVAATGVLAGPVVAGMVVPGVMTDLAEQGLRVNHRHFVFHEQFPIQADGREWEVLLYDADLYEMPLSTQVVLRGAILPAPTEAELQMALRKVSERYTLPVLSYDVQRSGTDITIKATLPAGLLANLSPEYRALMAKYEA
jgi:hypothetical protein